MAEDTGDEAKKKKDKKPPRELAADWKPSTDGALSRTFAVTSDRETTLLAGRVVRYAVKAKVPIELRCDESEMIVRVRMPEGNGPKRKVGRKQVSFAGQVDRWIAGRSAKQEKASPAGEA